MQFELLPNEIFNECFQYLNAFDIFYSFDRLNYRFYSVIRNSPLYLNFQPLKKFQFNDFCQTILSNPEIKQNIISLQLSNIGTCGEIQLFLSLFPLNEFINLRSLSLIDIENDNIQQILPMLPFLSNLYQLSCSSTEYKSLEIMPALLKSKIRILKLPNVDMNSLSIDETIPITSLTISYCHLSDVCQLFQYTPMLKYLKIERLSDNSITGNELNLINTSAVHLKQLIVDSSTVEFQVLELLLNRIPNLQIFSIFAKDNMEMFDANRWQHLIESYLPHLHIFKFKFDYCSSRLSSDEKLIEFRKFQTDFWHKQHHWYTNYEIDSLLVSVYTLPYARSEYTLTTMKHEYGNSNEFDNVNKLSIWTRAITDDSPYYFRNIQSLRLTNGYNNEGKKDWYELRTEQIEFLGMIVNLSNIKHLIIDKECRMTSSFLSKLLKNMPNVSSLTIKKDTLISSLENREFCKYLNKKIKTLDISGDWVDRYIPFKKIRLFGEAFSNIEQLQCHIGDIHDLLQILAECSKLSMIKIVCIDQQTESWIETNASTLNVYIDLRAMHCEYEDL
jgi:hypothetical protein